MNLESLLEHLNAQKPIEANSKQMEALYYFYNESRKIICELNYQYHEKTKINDLFSKIINKPVDDSFTLFPPVYVDFGKNLYIGKNVFINQNVSFQDQGGIYLHDNVQVGHNVVFSTLNHDLDPQLRKNVIPKPIIVEQNVWIGSNATILQGVKIGKNAVVAAGAVVNKDVPENTVVGGVPAKVIKNF
ncbi:DapH/DapD/GlmU-related protein [Spiroplasma culicicola]|uniref:Acetyltransferase n=1 Tax=Spiroplasma culicicola AES-1 TaxID=1276246 RepID=W6A820_9MOLU|nr:hypothetical protein SCULI_v1c06940 [Spiroplasma culicicola AES-1]